MFNSQYWTIPRYDQDPRDGRTGPAADRRITRSLSNSGLPIGPERDAHVPCPEVPRGEHRDYRDRQEASRWVPENLDDDQDSPSNGDDSE